MSLRLDRIKVISQMARLDMNSNELCGKSGLSRCTITAVRSGKKCSNTSANLIVRALGVDVTELLDDGGIHSGKEV